LTPDSSIPKGLSFKPITVLSTPNLACTLVSTTEAAGLLGGTVTERSLSDGSCRFSRSTPGAYGAPAQVFIEVQPLTSLNEHIFHLLNQEKVNRHFIIDGSKAVWVSLPLPFPNPKSEGGSLSIESGGNFVSAGAQNVPGNSLGISETLMSTALSRLRAG
jgi:hypothetical protein